MAPRANWKGFLKLSLVTCPVALFPATSETEKVSFNQINRKTGHRIKYTKVDAESGEDVPAEDIIKGYKVDTDTYVTIDNDELDNIALESEGRRQGYGPWFVDGAWFDVPAWRSSHHPKPARLGNPYRALAPGHFGGCRNRYGKAAAGRCRPLRNGAAGRRRRSGARQHSRHADRPGLRHG